jgi:trehalose 6-phosphate phosphatase
VPSTDAGREALAALLAEPGRALLVSDYDGTLAPIVRDPDQAVPQPGAIDALALLSARLGGLALLTGRPVRDVLALGGLERVPGLLVLGRYGAQRWSGGLVVDPLPPPGLAAATAALADLLPGEPGAYLEDKGDAVAVHTRPAPDPSSALDRLRPAVEAVAAATGLLVQPGRLVLELRGPGPGKGEAVRALVAERQPGSVVFLGDDAGDLPAFEALTRLRLARTTRALLVASASAEEPRSAEVADLVLDGPPGVAAFLGWLADSLS